MSASLLQSTVHTVHLQSQRRDAWKLASQNLSQTFPEDGNIELFLANAIAMAREIIASSPELEEGLTLMREGEITSLVLENLPHDSNLPSAPRDGLRPAGKGPLSEEVLLGLMSPCGQTFGYIQERKGKLVHEVAPIDGMEALSTGGGRANFAGHIDNSFLNYSFRPTLLGLIGLVNENETPTLIYEIDEIVDRLSRRSSRYVEELFKPHFRIRCPLSFGFRNAFWVEGRPLLEEVDGKIIGGFNHGFNIEAMPEHETAADAYAVLCEVISELDATDPIEVIIRPGSALIFNNCRVMHARRPIDAGQRWLQRVYGSAYLDRMQAASGSTGRIFDARLFL